MRKHFNVFSLLLLTAVLFAACSPQTFTPPLQIQPAPAEQMTRPVMVMDAAGTAHIAGIVNDRILYYRTVMGPPAVTLTMTMPGSGAGWKQFAPDIAVTDDGTTYLAWVEQRGTSGRIACYQVIPFAEPAGGYDRACIQLDPTHFAQGNIMVAAKQSHAYVLYDRVDAGGKVDSLWFRKLSGTEPAALVHNYNLVLESGYLFSWDAEIDADGFLHVALLENDGKDLPPHTNRVVYRSNRALHLDGSMGQTWSMLASNDLEGDSGTSLAFVDDGGGARVTIAAVVDTAGIDSIRIYSCTITDCLGKTYHLVQLPASWSIYSEISDVELVTVNSPVVVGFIGDNGTEANAQVYIKYDALSTNNPAKVYGKLTSHKMNLQSAVVTRRPGSFFSGPLEVFSWGETDLMSVQFYSYDSNALLKVYDTPCASSPLVGEAEAYGTHYAGVWEACGASWFTAWAENIHLPMVTR